MEVDRRRSNAIGTTSPHKNSRKFIKLLFPQALVGFMDSLAFMIVTPSLSFYVKQAGGTLQQYGTICSAFAFASFTFKPILGYWSDRMGHKFRIPYLTSIAIAALGAFLYFVASFVVRTNSPCAIALIFAGRFLGGCGAANTSLGYAYIHQVVPPDQTTKANAVLSMVRVLGMSIAPGFNALLYRVKFQVHFGPLYTLDINPLNFVGIVICLGNLLSFMIMYYMLVEPSQTAKGTARAVLLKKGSFHDAGKDDVIGITSPIFWKNVCHPSILMPILSYFTLFFNFQFIGTALAPAANDALGWEMVAISIVFGLDGILVFFVYILTFQLSAFRMGDIMLMKIGLWCSTVGYTLVYLWWRQGVPVWMFVLPIVICTSGTPFMGPPTRSIFSFAVSQNEVLCRHHGTLQAILSMTSSIAGVLAPSFMASFVLRTHEEAASDSDHRILDSLALIAPALASLSLCWLTCVQDHYDYNKKNPPDMCHPAGVLASLEEIQPLKGRDGAACLPPINFDEDSSVSSWSETTTEKV